MSNDKGKNGDRWSPRATVKAEDKLKRRRQDKIAVAEPETYQQFVVKRMREHKEGMDAQPEGLPEHYRKIEGTEPKL